MRIRQIVTFLLTGLALMLATGCERTDNQTLASEADEPYYRQGQQLVKQGRSQEALAAYLKVIARRGESAPESHLEAGLLYLEQIKDPLAAIYHFRKYLELQPNSIQAPKVKGLVDAAKREFARTLPAQPLESQTERQETLNLIASLQRENDLLKAELAAMGGGVSSPTIRSRIAINNDAVPEKPRIETTSRPFIAPRLDAPETTADSPVSLAPEPAARPTENSPAVQPAPFSPPRSVPTKPAPPAAGPRIHVVVKGDTLFSLAQKYYGNRSKWRDIYAANRDVLPSENALRLGMELKIP